MNRYRCYKCDRTFPTIQKWIEHTGWPAENKMWCVSPQARITRQAIKDLEVRA